MLSMVYMSVANQVLDRIGLARLERQAADRNALLGVTGLLVGNGFGYLQLIEGPAGAVEQVFRSIARDPRHFDLEVLRRDPCAARECPDWAMRALSAPLRVKGSASRFTAAMPETMALETRVMFTSFAASAARPVMA